MTELEHTTVFFNLFAGAEPSANKLNIFLELRKIYNRISDDFAAYLASYFWSHANGRMCV